MEKKGIIVGLTGQTGAGKSTVSRMLTERGYQVLDADLVARQVVEKGKKCLLDLVLEFGTGILDSDGGLNRRKLADLVFSDPQKRKTMNRITFPYIQEEIFSRAREILENGCSIVFLDAPTLLESGSHKSCDMVVSVIADVDRRLDRLLERDDTHTRGELEKRIAAQHNDAYYTSRSDFVIDNDEGLTELRVKVVEMLEMAECRLKQRGDKT